VWGNKRELKDKMDVVRVSLLEIESPWEDPNPGGVTNARMQRLGMCTLATG